MTRVLAVGAGLGGRATAIALSVTEVDLVVFERALDQTFAWRLARAGAWRNPAAWGMRNAFLTLSVPVAWRMQVKDMTLPT
jgi:cation diffusion facilitator CzcD-associated flavoprotein CzcO